MFSYELHFHPSYILQGNMQKRKHEGNWLDVVRDENSEFLAKLHADPPNSWSLTEFPSLLLPSHLPNPLFLQ